MAFSEEFTQQMEAIQALVETVTDLKINAKANAFLMVQIKMLHLLASKGLISPIDIDSFIREIETASANMSKTTPAISAELADLALQLRNALIQTNGKPN